MKYYKTVQSEKQKFVSIKCDVCGTIYVSPEEDFEIQEFHCVDFVGGYGSVFGDLNKVQCDICQKCLMKMIKPYCTIESYCRMQSTTCYDEE